jgi:hypothetical protein
MASKHRNLLLSIITFTAAAGSISAATTTSQLSNAEKANAQTQPTLTQGQITATLDGKLFEGENIGNYSVALSGQKVLFIVHIYKSPTPGKFFEAWLADDKSNKRLNLGQISPQGALTSGQDTVNALSYNQIIITQGPIKGSNPNTAQPMGGAVLKAPFGNKFIY